jgi:hypothetical protein
MDAINDIEHQQREQRRQAKADAELFEELVRSKVWGRFTALLEQVAQNHHAVMMKPVESLLEMPKMEFSKGVLSGLSFAGSLPHMKIKEAQEMRRATDVEE